MTAKGERRRTRERRRQDASGTTANDEGKRKTPAGYQRYNGQGNKRNKRKAPAGCQRYNGQGDKRTKRKTPAGSQRYNGEGERRTKRKTPVPQNRPGRRSRSVAPTALGVSIYHGPSAYALG
jgi:hypothetical protein